MAAKDYEFRLRYQNRSYDRVQSFSRGLDFDQILDADRILLWWLVATVKRAGFDPRKDLDEFEIEVWDKGRNRQDRIFAASRNEITDDMLQ
ncbi:hypothetical protein [Dactylosporangium sp. NPDC051484]|uniref:hypothetical protein n=1 Tax=Dactylosporangium sp. NPDC051484 TaxID=3154942 RepID=UPI00344DB1A0